MSKQDLTQGNVTKTLVNYAVPMIITSLFQSVYSIIDIIFVGRFNGGDAISAINNSSLIMNMLTQIAIGLTVGGNVLISQYFGSKQEKNQKEAAGTLFVLCMILSVITGALFFAVSRQLLVFLGAPSLDEATLYLKICSAGMVFIFGYNALSAIMRALGNSKKPMQIIIISSISNVVLDFIFVVMCGLGVAGAALGTLLSQGISFIIALSYVLRNKHEYGFESPYFTIRPDKALKIVKLGFPIALQWTVASISWLAVTFLINKYGISVSAGNGVSNKIKDFCQLFITAMTSAASTMAAQNLGARLYDRAKHIMKICMHITLGIAAVMIIISEIAAPVLVSFFTSESAVAQSAILNLRIEIIAQLFYAAFLTYNVLATGSGNTMFVMANSFLNCIVVRLILAFVLEHFFGILGVYAACMIAPLSSVPVGYVYCKMNIWRKSIADKSTEICHSYILRQRG